MPLPACPVRGCARPLERHERRFACAAGHSFDLARSGYLNLLQPQDRKSGDPGDSAEAVAARARLVDAGATSALEAVTCDLVDELAPAGRLAVLDVGCGEGFMLRALASRREIDACGVDLSSSAAQAAARRRPDALVVVANADRALPWAAGSFDVVLSITARRPVAEMARVLAPGGLLVVAVPAPDDLVELRERVLGRGERLDRTAALTAELAPAFEEVARRRAALTLRLQGELLRDALASTYRGGRASRDAAAAGLEAMDVTLAQDVLAFRLRGGHACA